jgi:hypothetical protein
MKYLHSEPNLYVESIMILVASMACFLILVCAYRIGETSYVRMKEQDAIDTDFENQRACDRLRAPVGSEHYVVCISELAEIRRLHEVRLRQYSGSF